MVDPVDPSAWQRTIRSRLLFVAVVLAVWVVAIEGRLVYYQVYLREFLAAEAENQQQSQVDVPARRGDIVDRHGRLLAYSVDVDSVFVVPRDLESIPKTIDALCHALRDCRPEERAAWQTRFANKASYFAWVRRDVTTEQAARLRALKAKMKGVSFMKEPHRFYPNRELAAHVLGYVGVDEQAWGGIEAKYDKLVRGKPSLVLIQHDRQGNAFSRVGDPPVPGASLELTIDKGLQHIAERELKAGVDENHAAGGSVVVMDPNTGEVLAMANEPTFNPNDFRLFDEKDRRNRAVQDSYEPGSTFKMITATAALDEKEVRPDEMIETGNGILKMPTGRVVRDTHGHGTIPFRDVIALSSNIGSIKVGWRLGASRLGKYVKQFGFGTRLTPDLPGENAGMLWDPANWKPYEALASVAMGYQIGVTPLQMAAAASTIANGGELVQPRLLRAVIRSDVRQVVPRKVLRRVMSPETAATLTSILEEVVDRGTAKTSQVAGFTVAGKTGTSAKLTPEGVYSKSEYNASFVGFLPSRKPVLTIIVMIDTPRAGKTYGGVVAAPIFQRIAVETMRYLAVPPTINPPAPVLVKREAPGEIRVAGPITPLTILAAPPQPNAGLVLPELRGLGGRDALRVLARLGLVARISGDGVVLEQEPAPGTPVAPGASCRLVLGRRSPREAKAGGLRP